MTQNGTEERGGVTCVGQVDLANEKFQERRASHSFKRIGDRTLCPFRVAALSMTAFSDMDDHDGIKSSKTVHPRAGSGCLAADYVSLHYDLHICMRTGGRVITTPREADGEIRFHLLERGLLPAEPL